MNTISKTMLVGFLLLGVQTYAQETKDKVFKCDASRIPDEYTSDAKFNGLVDKACLEINNGQYENGLRTLNEAIQLDSISSGLANEYFKTIRRKLSSFIEENGIKSTSGSTSGSTAITEPVTPKQEEKIPEPAPQTKPTQTQPANTPPTTEPAAAAPEVKTISSETTTPEPKKEDATSASN